MPFDYQPSELTLDNFPTNVSAFKAASWREALSKIETALLEDGKQSAVWLMGEQTPYQILEPLRKRFFQAFFDAVAFEKNYRKKLEEISVRESMIDYLSPEAQEAFDALISQKIHLDVIQRYQIQTPPETSFAHFDIPLCRAPDKPELPNQPGRFLKGRNLRLIFLEAGDNPILFGPSKAPLKVENFRTGAIGNHEDLGSAWQARGKTFTAITNRYDWGLQALPHASPCFQSTPASFRAQTVYTIIR